MKKIQLLPTDITIAICTLDRPHYLAPCLEAIKDYSGPVIVYDNGTPKQTPKFAIYEALRQKYEKENLTWIRSEINEGLPKAWNQGIIKSKTDWVLLLADDVLMDKNWLTQANEILNSRENLEQVHLLSFNAILLHKKNILRLGWWDERFRCYPSSEDDDYYLRIVENLGYSPYVWPGNHIQGKERERILSLATSEEIFNREDNFTYFVNSQHSKFPIINKTIGKENHEFWKKYKPVEDKEYGIDWMKKKWVRCEDFWEIKNSGHLLNKDGSFWKRRLVEIDFYPTISQYYKELYVY